MRPGVLAVLFLSIGLPALAAPPRVTFDRVIPAPHDLGKAEDISLVSAIGDTEGVEWFVDHLVEQINRSGTIRMRDDRRTRNLNADAFLNVNAFTCASREQSGERSTHDADGKRVRRKEVWIESQCTARVDVRAAGGPRSSFAIKGNAASAHVLEITADEREDALMRAARYAAIDAAEKITPRRVRESIPLDETGPAFEDGWPLIAAARLAETRTLWEEELRRHPRSAALHYNLAAICEALGDRTAAERYYMTARELAPQEKRYATELKLFMRRR